MTRNLKALGLALLAICALGAVAAQGASADVDHEFHAAEPDVIATGHSKDEPRASHTFAVGAAGTVTCATTQTESTQVGTLVSAGTYKTDKITVIPHYKECVFAGGNPATVNFNHCAYVFDSETTKGNKTSEVAEHANVEIECANAGEKIEIHTNLCTVFVEPQTVKHGIKYKNITGTNGKASVTVEATAHSIIVKKARTTASQPLNGCLTFPLQGEAAGTYTGDTKVECFEDLGSELTGTDKTTPEGKTTEGVEGVNCTVSPGA